MIDRVEHPRAPARKAGDGVPVDARRAQLLARVLRPDDRLRVQRRSRDGRRRHPGEADADAEEAQVRARRRVPRSRRTATSAPSSPGWHDHGSISAIDVTTGKRVWKFDTPEPERGGVSTTASGLGFAGGGDGILRAFDSKTGKRPLEVPDRPPIAAGPTIFSADGTEYIAITSAGRRPHPAAASRPSCRSSSWAVRRPSRRPRSPTACCNPQRLRRSSSPPSRRPSHGGSSRAREARVSRPRSAACRRLERRPLEHEGRDGTPAVRRQAGRGRGDAGGQLHRAEPHQRERPVLLPARYDDPAPPRRARAAPLGCAGGRQCAHSRGAVGCCCAWPAASASATRSTSCPRGRRGGHVVVTGRLSYGDGSPCRRSCCRPTGSPARSPTLPANRWPERRLSRAPRTATSGPSRSRAIRAGTTSRSSPHPTRRAPTRCR